jgi:hypothetical protein
MAYIPLSPDDTLLICASIRAERKQIALSRIAESQIERVEPLSFDEAIDGLDREEARKAMNDSVLTNVTKTAERLGHHRI